MRVFDNPLKKRFKRSFKLKTTLRLKLKFGDFRKKLYNSLELKDNVGSRFGGSFTVGMSEPKPNRPNTMNLVEKRAQEPGLCEDFINSRAGSPTA